jgi:hypothetical protein
MRRLFRRSEMSTPNKRRLWVWSAGFVSLVLNVWFAARLTGLEERQGALSDRQTGLEYSAARACIIVCEPQPYVSDQGSR